MKQVIVVREDLKISPGKIAVQVAHAAVTGALKVKSKKKMWFFTWEMGGQKKVVLKVKNLKELYKIKSVADKASIPNSMIKDAGLTEIPPGTETVLSLGPAPEKEIDKIVGSLPLY